MALSTKEFCELVRNDGFLTGSKDERFIYGEIIGCGRCPIDSISTHLSVKDTKYVRSYNLSGCAHVAFTMFFAVHPDTVKRNKKKIVQYIDANKDRDDAYKNHLGCNNKITGKCCQFLKKLYELLYAEKGFVMEVE